MAPRSAKRSEPVTASPPKARIWARALIPLPATPTKWIFRRWRAGSAQVPQHEADETAHPRGVGRVHHPERVQPALGQHGALVREGLEAEEAVVAADAAGA